MHLAYAARAGLVMVALVGADTMRGMGEPVDCGLCETISDFDDVCPTSYFQHFFSGFGANLVTNPHWIASCKTCEEHNHSPCSSAKLHAHDEARLALSRGEVPEVVAAENEPFVRFDQARQSLEFLDCGGDVESIVSLTQFGY
jgi:hypothetical protein